MALVGGNLRDYLAHHEGWSLHLYARAQRDAERDGVCWTPLLDRLAVTGVWPTQKGRVVLGGKISIVSPLAVTQVIEPLRRWLRDQTDGAALAPLAVFQAAAVRALIQARLAVLPAVASFTGEFPVSRGESDAQASNATSATPNATPNATPRATPQATPTAMPAATSNATPTASPVSASSSTPSAASASTANTASTATPVTHTTTGALATPPSMAAQRSSVAPSAPATPAAPAAPAAPASPSTPIAPAAPSVQAPPSGVASNAAPAPAAADYAAIGEHGVAAHAAVATPTSAPVVEPDVRYTHEQMSGLMNIANQATGRTDESQVRPEIRRAINTLIEYKALPSEKLFGLYHACRQIKTWVVRIVAHVSATVELWRSALRDNNWIEVRQAIVKVAAARRDSVIRLILSRCGSSDVLCSLCLDGDMPDVPQIARRVRGVNPRGLLDALIRAAQTTGLRMTASDLSPLVHHDDPEVRQQAMSLLHLLVRPA